VSLNNAEVEEIKAAALAAIASANSLDQLREVKITFVGDRSPIARANQSLGQLPVEERAAMGKVIGDC
jgi:phenylalanyl-tRNA synthetase alpha chain